MTPDVRVITGSRTFTYHDGNAKVKLSQAEGVHLEETTKNKTSHLVRSRNETVVRDARRWIFFSLKRSVLRFWFIAWVGFRHGLLQD